MNKNCPGARACAIVVSLLIAVGTAGHLWAATGMAEMKGTAPNSSIKGTIHLNDTAAGLHVSAQFIGLPPGEHAFHIHEFGDCSDMGKAAGSHYNPLHSPHGNVLKDGVHKAHVGDMGNIMASAAGEATLDVTLHDIALGGGNNNVGGRAIILHEKIDDFSQPVGNAGGRIACGTIVLTGN